MLLRGRNTEGVGEGYFYLVTESVPSGQQGARLHQRKVGKEEERSTFTTGAGLSQGRLVFPGCAVRW